MTKQEYLVELERSLQAAHVEDCTDIMEEYAEHFDMKMRDGYGEEEVAARLAAPKEIAEQFAAMRPGRDVGKGVQAVLATGIVCADIFVVPIFLALCAWVIAMGFFSIAAAGLGIVVITGFPLWNMMPYMPFISALFAGIALLALAALSAVGMEYSRLYIAQLIKVYFRWHKSAMGNKGRGMPPLPMHPQIAPKKRRMMRGIALGSLSVCGICCVAWYASMAIITGAFEPWHALNWFR